MRILILDPEPLLARGLQKHCGQWDADCTVVTAFGAEQAQSIHESGAFDLVIAGLDGDPTGHEATIRWLCGRERDALLLLILPEQAPPPLWAGAARCRADELLQRPVSIRDLFAALSRLRQEAERLRRRRELARLGGCWEKNAPALRELLNRELLGLAENGGGDALRSSLPQALGMDLDRQYLPVLFRAYGPNGSRTALTAEQRRMIAGGLLHDLSGRGLLPHGLDCYAITAEADPHLAESRCIALQQRFGEEAHVCCFLGQPVYWEQLARQRELLCAAADDCITLEPRVQPLARPSREGAQIPPLPEHWPRLLRQNRMAELEQQLAELVTGTPAFVQNRAQLHSLSGALFQLAAAQLLQRDIAMDASFLQALPPENIPQLLHWWHELLVRCAALRVSSGMRDERGRIVRQIMQYIEGHLSESLNRETLAQTVNLSANYLARIFREETGKTINDTIVEIRIRRAAELIRNSDESISAIAQRCGYSNFSYFSMQFREQLGQTPREYRKGLFAEEETPG